MTANPESPRPTSGETRPDPNEPEFVIIRVLPAPRALVFRAWTDPQLMAQWWGPHQYQNPVCELDARPGGQWRIVMTGPHGDEHPCCGEYREVVAPERLVMTIDHSLLSDEWHNMVNPQRRPGSERPKLEALMTVTFEDAPGPSAAAAPYTKLTIRSRFESIAIRDALLRIGMNEGWSQSLEKLAAVAGGSSANPAESQGVMTMKVQPYLCFEGRCEEALDFYRRAIGAEVNRVLRFSESPVECAPGMVPPGSEHKIMHASFQVGETEIMASDGRCGGQPTFQGISLTIAAPTEAEVERLFNALADGGQIRMPLGKTFFSASFGMVTDRFGVSWMVLVGH